MEWIKVNKLLHTNFKVLMIAEALGMDPELIAYKIIQVWAFADTECTAENPRINAPSDLLDKLVRCPGLAKAMADLGWLIVGDGWFEFPKFERHMGKSAKLRALDAEKKRCKRDKIQPSGDKPGTERGQNGDNKGTTRGQAGDKTGTEKGLEERREEERREEENNKTIPPLPPKGDGDDLLEIKGKVYDPKTAYLPSGLDTPAFRKAWEDWWKSRRERRLPSYKPTTIAKTLERFLAMGEELAIATIENSIMNAYQGLVEPNQKYQPRPQAKPGISQVKPMSERIAEAKAARKALASNLEIPLSVIAHIPAESPSANPSPPVSKYLQAGGMNHG
jgi:hypothetical protein